MQNRIKKRPNEAKTHQRAAPALEAAMGSRKPGQVQGKGQQSDHRWKEGPGWTRLWRKGC